MTLKHFVRQHDPVLLISATDLVNVVIDRMIDDDFGAALIVSPDGRLIGIFTERDVLTKIVGPGLDPTRVSVAEVMTTQVVTIEEEQSLDAAIHCIQAYQVSHLPIVDESYQVVSVLTIRRLLHDKVKDLIDGLHNLEAYFNDAPGG